MTEVTLDSIRVAARNAHEKREPWHFHILSPACVFNTVERYAFVIESASSEPLVHYSNRAEKELGAELSPLLHRPESTEAQEQVVTATERHILDTAKELNEHGTEWHHHVLFPGCSFNEESGKFCLILENPETNIVLKAISDSEPRQVLKELEPLFYRNV